MRHANCKQRAGLFSWRTLAIIMVGGFIAQQIIFALATDTLTNRLEEIRSIAELQGGWVFFDLSE